MLNKSIANFGFLSTYIEDDNVTDINYNGKTLWIDDLKSGRYSPFIEVDDDEIDKICYQIANRTNQQFNNTYPILESEIGDLRVSIVHKSVARGGHSISIRKSPAKVRLIKDELIESGYCNLEVLDFLKVAMNHKLNIIISGQPGAGKTELLKYLTNYIKANDRVITIEDTSEIKYQKIQPLNDGVSYIVNDVIDYSSAIKASLRQRPNYILLSEVRGSEVIELLQAVSTGSTMLTTIHAESASKIPYRLLHMLPGMQLSNTKLLNYVCGLVDIGIHIDLIVTEKGITRMISEISYYDVVDEEITIETIYSLEDPELKIPTLLKKRFESDSLCM